jgi:hypothetical protein
LRFALAWRLAKSPGLRFALAWRLANAKREPAVLFLPMD